jgi:VIT1/CCC1 family predicted Fe2+/Mn2+ transporter
MQRAWEYISRSLFLCIAVFLAAAMLVAFIAHLTGLEIFSYRTLIRSTGLGVLAGLMVYYNSKPKKGNQS